jgi:hypothetical protein
MCHGFVASASHSAGVIWALDESIQTIGDGILIGSDDGSSDAVSHEFERLT